MGAVGFWFWANPKPYTVRGYSSDEDESEEGDSDGRGVGKTITATRYECRQVHTLYAEYLPHQQLHALSHARGQQQPNLPCLPHVAVGVAVISCCHKASGAVC